MRNVENKEDRLLLERLRKGYADGLKPIYEKYKIDMLAVAIAMAPDRPTAEDVVHDVFISFAGIARYIKIRKNLKSYLLTCIANRIRNIKKVDCHCAASIGNMDSVVRTNILPDHVLTAAEEGERLQQALAALPDSQKEVILLHHMEGLRFQTIAKSQGESINTIQSRYRYGMRKLRAFFAGGNKNV